MSDPAWADLPDEKLLEVRMCDLGVSIEGTDLEPRIAKLNAELEARRLKLEDTIFAAQQFLQMVIALPQRRAMGLGPPMSKRELTEWPHKVVDLFLNGCRCNKPMR